MGRVYPLAHVHALLADATAQPRGGLVPEGWIHHALAPSATSARRFRGGDGEFASQADAYVSLLDSLGIDKTPILAFSAGSTSAVLLALRHPERVSALVLAAANAPHDKPVTLAPRPLAPLVFSQPSLWFLRLSSCGGNWPASRVRRGTTTSQPRTGGRSSRSSTASSPWGRARRTIFDGYVGNLGDRPHAPSNKSPFRRSASTRATIRSPPTRTHARWWLGSPAAAGSPWPAAGAFLHKNEEALTRIARFLEERPRHQPSFASGEDSAATTTIKDAAAELPDQEASRRHRRLPAA